MALSDVAYRIYEARLVRDLADRPLPRHVAVILDGNRRFARQRGGEVAEGHAAGARKIDEFLDWCWELGIPYVTLWLLSTENLDREAAEIAALLQIIEETVTRIAEHPKAAERGLQVSVVGATDLLPEQTRATLARAEEATRLHDRTFLQVAVGYGGRQEIVDAVRSLLRERAGAGDSLADVAANLAPEDIGAHLYTSEHPDPDLIIRTSGEVRLSGFLLWQSAHSEFHFADPYWPEFRRVDFLRALRDYGRRVRRFGR